MSSTPSLDHWTRERRCVVCGGTFTLAAHGTPEAQDAARHLQHGTLDAAALPPLVSKCPDCLAGRTPQSQNRAAPVSPTKEQQAVAAAMAIGEQMGRARYDDVYYYAKRIGMAVGILGVFGIVLVVGYDIGYGRIGEDEFNPVLWLIGLAILAIGGFGASLWAFQQSRSK